MEEEKNKEIPSEVLGVKLDDAAIAALKSGKETELIKGLISQRTGKPFDAFLKLGAGNTVKFRFPVKAKKGFAKSTKVPTSVGGVKLDEEDIEDLKEGRETKLIVGIESKKSPGRTYDAFLRWTEKGGLKFRFPGQD